jgi:hypothetical protein
MSQLLDRVYSNVNACSIEVAFIGVSVPSFITGWQPFFNETFQNSNFQKAYASISSINFSETSSTANGNTSYKQKVEFTFPVTDDFRAERIALLHKLKFIKVMLNNGTAIVLGRNDVTQNAFPNITSKSNTTICQIEVETQSIAPAGFTSIINNGPPVIIPLTMNPYYETFTYADGAAQTFDLGQPVTVLSVVLNEGRVLKEGTEWTISGDIITILYDSLYDGDTIYITGLEGQSQSSQSSRLFANEFSSEFE